LLGCYLDTDLADFGAKQTHAPANINPYIREALMPFILAKDRICSAIDQDTNSRMVINSGPQIEYNIAKFSSPAVSLDVQIEIRLKYPSEAAAPNDPSNPGVMISAGFIEWQLKLKKMSDVEYNTKIVDLIVRMIAFINKHYPLAPVPYLWSDYNELPNRQRLSFRMPSDADLIKISE